MLRRFRVRLEMEREDGKGFSTETQMEVERGETIGEEYQAVLKRLEERFYKHSQ